MLSEFQVVIPMSGFGSRFKTAGYKKPKPLIELFGKPLIEYVLKLFPGETDILCIVNKEHIRDFQIDKVLLKINPNITIFSIEPHSLGPIHAVMSAKHLISRSKPVAVNYCDFSMSWDWQNVKDTLLTNDYDGLIPAYRGFHPHSNGTTNYAYIKHTDDLNVQDVQEKKPYTNKKVEEFASTGTYIFKTGQLMLDIFDDVLLMDLNTNGEFYCSAAFGKQYADQFRYRIYPINYFCQWGTPTDLEFFREYISNLLDFNNNEYTQKDQSVSKLPVLLPMAGKGSRFHSKGYKTKKPYLNFDSYGPLFELAASSFGPRSQLRVHTLVHEDQENAVDQEDTNRQFKSFSKTPVNEVTSGQASSTKYLIDAQLSQNKLDAGFNVAPCDAYINAHTFPISDILKKNDLIVWVKEINVPMIDKPEQYSWMEEQTEGNEIILKAAPKNKIASQLTGFFSFKNSEIFEELYNQMVTEKRMVNGEYYIDTMAKIALENSLTVQFCKISNYLCFGTPYEYETNNYFQEFLNDANSIL